MWNMRNKQNKINEQTKQKQTRKYREQSGDYQMGRGRARGVVGRGRVKWLKGIKCMVRDGN